MPRWHVAPSLRLRSPLIILLASIGLTAVAVFDAQRAVRSQRDLARQAIRDYASFAAWSYAQHLNETLNGTLREALGAVNHGDNMHTSRRIPFARELAHYLPYDSACGCHRTHAGPAPETFFAMKIGRDSVDVGLNTHSDPMAGWEVDRPMSMRLPTAAGGDYTSAERRWLVDTLTRRIRHAVGPDHGYSLVVGDGENAPRIVAYTLMPTSWGDTMVYGARYSSTAVASMLAGVLDGDGLLPATFTAGRRNRDIVTVRVRDQHGHTLFNSAPRINAPLDAHLDLPSRAGLLSLDAGIRPELAGTLLIGGLPSSHLPFLMGLLALAATMSLIAVAQLRREGELARLRADFVSSVSHELRTPLAQIRLYVDTLRLGRAKTEEQRDWSLGHIERETTRLGHLVENTLRFSRLGHDGSAPADPIDAGAEVERIVGEFRPLAEARQACIETQVESSAMLPLRPDALRHMLLNLLDNAVKYGPAGQVILVRVSAQEGEVRVVVEDQGPGIASSERERVWRPFLRGGAARGHGGSGIGLTIVREVAEQHGGRAWVDAAPGRGARFTIALPVERPAAEVR
jgi:signal transduction histidine kinase